MKTLSLFLILFLIAVPAHAQDAAVTKDQLALAGKMHEIWPIRTRVEMALDAVAQSFPAEKQAQMKATMRKNIKFDQLEEESIRAMAEIFTAEELQAMIDFYGSDIGRSISAKTGDYEMALRPIMTKMMDKAMLDLRTGTAQ